MAFIKVIPTPTATLDPQPAKGCRADGGARGGEEKPEGVATITPGAALQSTARGLCREQTS